MQPAIGGVTSQNGMDSIPIVNYADLRTDRNKFVRDLDHALSEIGFMVVTNVEGLEDSFQQELFAQAHRLFDAPNKTKQESCMSLSPNYRGWTAPAQVAGQKLEAYQYGFEQEPKTEADGKHYWRNITRGHNNWPDAHTFPTFRPAVEALRERYLALTHELGHCICEALGVDKNKFDDLFDINDPDLAASLNHNFGLNHFTEESRAAALKQYARESPADTHALNKGEGGGWVRATLGKGGAHVDGPPFITLLMADKPGLQVLMRRDTWVNVPVIPGAVVVNVGSTLMHLSNRRMVATVHRANTLLIPPDETRVSLPFFLLPKFDGDLIPFDETPSSSDENWLIKKGRDRGIVCAEIRTCLTHTV
jgi:isopenicillin N synthase-like dioxygenase